MTTETAQTTLVGAYTPYTCVVIGEAKKSFDEAVKGLVGVSYSPVAVSQQLVVGTNYKFFCNTRATTLPTLQSAAILSIYQPTEGPAHITHIQTL